MFRTLLLSSALTLAAAGAAFAADLPSTKGEPVYAPPPAPIFTWTGFYIGVNGGYGGNNNKYDFTDFEGITDYAKITSGGFVAGGTVGLNYQVPTSNFVIGFEGDFDWANIRGELAEGGSEFDGGELAEGSVLQWLATARGRIGYAVTTPFGNLLPYVTGGAAFGHVKDYEWETDEGSVSLGHTWTGWTAGLGLEYAITQNLTFKAEYLYVDLGQHTLISEEDETIYEHQTANIVRAGLNWKFDWFTPPPPPPVVAKY
ncbi:MAG: outer membrane protein [Methylovirgula sp.]